MSWSLKIPFVFLLFLGVLSTSKVKKKKANKFWLVVFMRDKLFESFVDANFAIHYIQKRFPFKGQWFLLFRHVAVCLFFLLIFLYVEKKIMEKILARPSFFTCARMTIIVENKVKLNWFRLKCMCMYMCILIHTCNKNIRSFFFFFNFLRKKTVKLNESRSNSCVCTYALNFITIFNLVVYNREGCFR